MKCSKCNAVMQETGTCPKRSGNGVGVYHLERKYQKVKTEINEFFELFESFQNTNQEGG
jgi:hypothetical protein